MLINDCSFFIVMRRYFFKRRTLLLSFLMTTRILLFTHLIHHHQNHVIAQVIHQHQNYVMTQEQEELSTNVKNTPKSQKPNLLVIMTDEQNFRTLNRYRLKTNQSQRNIWGEGSTSLSTPNIDALADEGVLFNKFYTVFPLCTPSRASFMTGLYPYKTNVYTNDSPMETSSTTFADILGAYGYDTAFMGKWHLNGDESPGFVTKNDFPFKNHGFNNTDYMWNRGHPKFINQNKDTTIEFSKDKNDTNAVYTTDFLFDRASEYIQNADKTGKPFALMVSIPDPHSPYRVRSPYDKMFDNYSFDIPETAYMELLKGNNKADWFQYNKWQNYKSTAEKLIRYEASNAWRKTIREYFGMIKLVDDRVGEIMKIINNSSTSLKENTIVVFTSDHGGLMMEHGLIGKGVPYEASIKVPFIVWYPKQVTAGKVVKSAYSSIDFTPTILSLMGVDWKNDGYKFDGVDASNEILSTDKISVNQDQTRFIYGVGWNAVVTSRYKLVFSYYNTVQFPKRKYLFDLWYDPDELVNHYHNSTYKEEAKKLEEELHNHYGVQKYIKSSDTSCVDFAKYFFIKWQPSTCNSVLRSKCSYLPIIRKLCPLTCNTCYKECKDVSSYFSLGDTMMKKKSCKSINPNWMCAKYTKARISCPVVCNSCPSYECQDSLGNVRVLQKKKKCQDLTLEDCDISPHARRRCGYTCGTCNS